MYKRQTLAWKAQKLIRTQYHRPLSTALLARELYCNADYLGRVYRRVFHLTLTEAIHRQRVREAEKLLISEARSLTEVAALCGFNDVGYFRQIFRKHTGLTPAAWKQMCIRDRYCALINTMTTRHNEVISCQSWRFVLCGVAGFLVSVGLPWMVDLFGQGNAARGYQLGVGVLCAIAVVMFLCCFFWVRERVPLSTICLLYTSYYPAGRKPP